MADDLRNLGVEDGETLMVHAALSAFGYVVGGTTAVLEALYDAVGEDGTIMMPAFTGELTDPKNWFKPPVPEEWWPRIRDEMPVFDPARTACSGLGVLAEMFRNEPGTLRSDHPVSSFTARGPKAEILLSNHSLDQRFGPESPLGRLCNLNGKVALLGAPYESITLLHMTSYLTGSDDQFTQRSPVLIDGKKQWIEFDDRIFSWRWFSGAVQHLIDSGIARVGKVGAARAIIVPATEAVEAVVKWREK
jgi:aminoglycoside 3-N-acetyltransferase